MASKMVQANEGSTTRPGRLEGRKCTCIHGDSWDLKPPEPLAPILILGSTATDCYVLDLKHGIFLTVVYSPLATGSPARY